LDMASGHNKASVRFRRNGRNIVPQCNLAGRSESATLKLGPVSLPVLEASEPDTA
jgi:hypothetical protein